MKTHLNQKLINLIEYYNSVNANILINDTPIIRSVENITLNFTGSKVEKLEKLKKKLH